METEQNEHSVDGCGVRPFFLHRRHCFLLDTLLIGDMGVGWMRRKT
jgi:hypothetical protein